MVKNKIKTKKKILIVFLIIVIISGFLGYFTCKLICKNDKFFINGNTTITLRLGQTYKDEGVTIIAFGKDISDNVKTENNINFNEAGQYYIKYSIQNIRFRGVERYRTIIIEEVENEN